MALTPARAFACPSCIAANEANRDAFLATTIFMSLLPLGMGAALLYFLISRAQAHAEAPASQPTHSEPPANEASARAPEALNGETT